MMARAWPFGLLVVASLLGAARGASGVMPAGQPSSPAAQPASRQGSRLHPAVEALSADGGPAASGAQFSAETSCGSCHDVAFIQGGSTHDVAHREVSCLGCHQVAEPRWGATGSDGALLAVPLAPGSPSSGSCGTCHGVVLPPEQAVLLPDQGESGASGGRILSLTLGEGAIISAQPMRSSLLNLAGKSELTSPWDVHAAKLVDCRSCHATANDPASFGGKRSELGYVVFDPRRLELDQYLERPDHHLAKEDCRSCHDPKQAHSFLPYRDRHMGALSCQACHLSEVRAPVLAFLDETVVTAKGEPRAHFRNQPEAASDERNTVLVQALRPLLVLRQGSDGAARLTPVNLVTRYRFVAAGRPVPFETVKDAYLGPSGYDESVRRVFDQNANGQLEPGELQVDAEDKAQAILARLRALGVQEPRLASEVEVHVLTHGVPSRERSLGRCEVCHGAAGEFSRDYWLASYPLMESPPVLPGAMRGGDRLRFDGRLVSDSKGLVFRHADEGALSSLYVLGVSRAKLSNQLGFGLFAFVTLALLLHALARVVVFLRRGPSSHQTPPEEAKGADRPREYVFGRYERFWHWTMAGSGLVLMTTGIIIHAGTARDAELGQIVTWHNAAAVVLMVNGFLGFFYHGATAALRNFIPNPRGLVGRMLDHIDYQTRGIFYGATHPKNAPGAKLNPLQQLTYLALLNFLFPFQIGTGVLMWATGTWPELSQQIGPLTELAPLHNLGSWAFITFLVLHVYLVTTGRTVGEHFWAMVTGYREADSDGTPKASEVTEVQASPAEVRTQEEGV